MKCPHCTSPNYRIRFTARNIARSIVNVVWSIPCGYLAMETVDSGNAFPLQRLCRDCGHRFFPVGKICKRCTFNLTGEPDSKTCPNCEIPFKRDLSKCLQCDYNLTGNTSGICPECGRPVDAQQPEP